MTYGYEELPEITPEQLLQKVTQEQIFELVLGKPFDFNRRYTSPLREDKRAGCFFKKREDGTILFIDFGDATTHRTCFKMVMEKEDISYNEMIFHIARHFNLPTDSRAYVEGKGVTYTPHREDYDEDRQRDLIIGYDKKPYDRRDKLHWSKFLIRPSELESDIVYSVKRFWYQKGDRPRRIIKPYTHCYAIDFLHAVKIYQPYSENFKWFTNCTQDDIGNFNNLPPEGDELVITKSYKDHRVLRNIGIPNVIWLLNEGSVPSLHILQNLVSRFKRIVILFDNDFIGTISAMKLCDILNNMREECAVMVHLPLFIGTKYWKDPAEFINKEGKQDLINILKQLL